MADRRLFGIFWMGALLMAWGPRPVGAQSAASAPALMGRLGGTLASMQVRFGTPSWTDTNLIGYNQIMLAGAPTIVVVYYDERQIVDHIALVYLERPQALATTDAIAGVVALVEPQDERCGPLASVESQTVVGCRSEALATPFSAEVLQQHGVAGSPGENWFAIDPNDDDYFEIVLRVGAAPAPEPPTLNEQYPPVGDAHRLASGDGFVRGDQLSISGSVAQVMQGERMTVLQVLVDTPDGGGVIVQVVIQQPNAGAPDSGWVTVYGVYQGEYCFTSADGGRMCGPTVVAMRVDV